MLLSERVATFIEQEALLDSQQNVVVGVSGGPDSLCLLHCLIDTGFKPFVAHFDHGIRPDSAGDADFVRETAESLGVPFHLGHGQDLDGDSSVEEGARIQRYQFLATTAMDEGINQVAVGHTANDQAETVLMHLIRGAGASGLRGMLPKAKLGSWVGVTADPDLHIVRPLLEIWRHETSQFCIERGLQTRSDSSNQDLRFFRNRLRNELLPELETYNPRVQEVLVRTAKVMAAEAEAFDNLLEERWPNWVTPAGDHALRLRAKEISSAPLALQRAAMRRAFLHLAPELRDISFASIERSLEAMRSGSRVSVPGGLELLSVNGDTIVRQSGFAYELEGYPLLSSKVPIALRIPGELQLQPGWRISSEEAAPDLNIPRSHDEVWFDKAELPDEFEVRQPRPGDRIAPLGMSGTMKVSDLFINRKVPKMARSTWPLVTTDNEVIWVPRLHRFHGARVTEDTQVMLKLRLERPE